MISTKAARQAAVPILVIQTSDAAQTFATILKELNGKVETCPILKHDLGNGCQFVSAPNVAAYRQPGKAILESLFGDVTVAATLNPTEFLQGLNKPDVLKALADAGNKLYVFMYNAQMIWSNEYVKQAIWNLRDVFKRGGSQLILMVAPGSLIPDELRTDTVLLQDTLPTVEELDTVVLATLNDAGLKPDKIGDRTGILDTLTGLSAFAAEQVLAMSITKTGIDVNALWERKRKMIEQTPGLAVWRGGETFEDVGGYTNAKLFMTRICRGRRPPKAVVFIDEIEKSMGGQGDTSGVNQDQLRTLLTFMQDTNARGVIFIGPPGSGKSVIAKAAGNDAGIPTISLDLGGMKNSLVGSSEARLRSALDVITSVSQGQTLFIATCNSIGTLPPELRRRFSLGTFYFPLPDTEGRAAIWTIYGRKYPAVNMSARPRDDGWTGAEIRNCVMIADDLNISLSEAAGYIVPVSISASEMIDRLNTDAHMRYISASAPGLFEYAKLSKQPAAAATTRRKIEVE